MTATRVGALPVLQLPVNRETMRRLLGGGCISCGATGALTPAGHAYTTNAAGGRLGWPVAACAQHQEAP